MTENTSLCFFLFSVRSEPASEAGAGGSYAMLGVSIGACALVLVLLLFLVILYMGYKKWQSGE